MIPILRLLRAATGSDRDLLDRYVRNQDEQAFESLMRRYGSGVWAACVRLAGRDAEDAFQAVFLLLSRKARTVTGSLPAWLHAATRRVASTTRRTRRRQATVEAAAARSDPSFPADPGLHESMQLLDEELASLPERYRAVLIVCCLEGRSRDEAATQLGWSEGQVKGRLERARAMLKDRLARRGVELGGLLLAASMAGPAPVRAHPPSSAALSLSNGVIRAMLIQKFRLSAVVFAGCLGIALAGGMALRAQPAQEPSVNLAVAAPPDKGKATLQEQLDESKKEIESLRKRIDLLERKLLLAEPERPASERRKIVLTNPRATDVVLEQRYVARIRAHRHINVSSLSNGVISEVLVREGQSVKKGDVLFNVMPVLYKAKLEAEQAEVQLAKIEMDNAKRLFAQKTVSQQELALTEAKMARAEAKMKLAQAELNFTSVRAPFDGLVGRVQEQEGSVVKDGTVLTTLSDNSAMWVYFNVPEARYLDFMAGRNVKEGVPVELVLANGKSFPQSGKLAAIEGQFQDDTGTIAFRADFANPDRLLRHGQSGNVLIRESLKNVIAIPRRAMFEFTGKQYVYVLDKDDVIHRREIVVRSEAGDLLVVSKGLDADERIVLDGHVQVRDGEKAAEFEFRRPKQ